MKTGPTLICRYFGIFVNKPGWWAIRLVTEARKAWIGFCLSEAEMRAVMPAGTGLEILPPTPWAAARVAISGPEDVTKLAPVVVAAFQRVIEDRKAGREAAQAGPASQA